MILKSADALEAWGASLAAQLRVGDILALSGELGAGKTTLARGILRGLGLIGEVPSPSFTIVQTYDPPDVTHSVWHVDLYRLDGEEDVIELGIEEAIDSAILIVEWPERMGRRLPDRALTIRLDGAGETERRLTVMRPPDWEGRCLPS